MTHDMWLEAQIVALAKRVADMEDDRKAWTWPQPCSECGVPVGDVNCGAHAKTRSPDLRIGARIGLRLALAEIGRILAQPISGMTDSGSILTYRLALRDAAAAIQACITAQEVGNATK